MIFRLLPKRGNLFFVPPKRYLFSVARNKIIVQSMRFIAKIAQQSVHKKEISYTLSVHRRNFQLSYRSFRELANA
jgi:hypothetical protein